MADPEKCVFCRIVNGLDNTEIVYQNDEVCVFKDIRPASKNHLLAIPKTHIKDPKCLSADHKSLVENLKSSLEEALKLVGDDLSDVRYGFHWPPLNSISHLHLHGISPASEMGFISRVIFKPNSFWFVTPEYILSRL